MFYTSIFINKYNESKNQYKQFTWHKLCLYWLYGVYMKKQIIILLAAFIHFNLLAFASEKRNDHSLDSYISTEAGIYNDENCESTDKYEFLKDINSLQGLKEQDQRLQAYNEQLARHKRSGSFIYHFDIDKMSSDDKSKKLEQFASFIKENLASVYLRQNKHEDNPAMESLLDSRLSPLNLNELHKLISSDKNNKYSRISLKLQPEIVSDDNGVEHMYYSLNVCINNYKKQVIYKENCQYSNSHNLNHELPKSTLLSRKLAKSLHTSITWGNESPNRILFPSFTKTFKAWQDNFTQLDNMKDKYTETSFLYPKADKSKMQTSDWKEDDLAANINFIELKD